MTVTVTALLTTAQLLLLVTYGGSCGLRSSNSSQGQVQGSDIKLTVINSITNTNQFNQAYSARTAYNGNLLGAMRRLQNTNCSFTFTTTENVDYGPYLESVNGVVGNMCDNTYWALLTQHADGSTSPLDLGIGCYLPDHNEHIILNFTKFVKRAK